MAKDKDTFQDTSIVWVKGATITLPEGMTPEEAARWCIKYAESQEKPVNILEEVLAFPLDGAYQFAKALKQRFGWVSQERGSGMVGVKIDAKGTTVQVPWGPVKVPGVEGTLTTAVGWHHGQPIFQIEGQVKAKHLSKVQELVALTRQLVVEASLYRGKAIRMSFNDIDASDKTFNVLDSVPEFMDLAEVRPDDLIFPMRVQQRVGAMIFDFITDYQRQLDLGVPRKRFVLLEGKYGTGKTMTALVAAKLCEQVSRTFIYLTNVAKIGEAMRFGKLMGGPVAIFCEDFDRVAHTRDDALNEIANTVDGVEFKDLEVLIVATTNHLEKIHKVMLRSGRIDVTIPLPTPDAQAAERLLRKAAGPLLPAGEDITDVCRLLEEQKAAPSSVKEIVFQAMQYAAHRSPGIPVADLRLNAADLESAALGIDDQLRRLNEPDEEEVEPLRRHARELGRALTGR